MEDLDPRHNPTGGWALSHFGPRYVAPGCNGSTSPGLEYTQHRTRLTGSLDESWCWNGVKDALLPPVRCSPDWSFYRNFVELATWPPAHNVFKALVYITLIVVVAEIISRRADLAPRDVPRAVTASVVAVTTLLCSNTMAPGLKIRLNSDPVCFRASSEKTSSRTNSVSEPEDVRSLSH